MESPRLRREQIPSFLNAIAHNRAMVAQQMRQRRWCDADFFFTKKIDESYHLMPPGNHMADNGRAFDDYVACSLIGALPFSETHGSDGIKVSPTGIISDEEVKLCMRDYSSFTPNNGYLSCLSSGKKRGPASSCSASFEIGNNLDKKNMDTHFVFFDRARWEIVTIWKLSGPEIIKRLSKNVPKPGERAKKLKISLASFMQDGEEVFLDFLPSVGLREWEDEIFALHGETRSESRSSWSSESDELIKVLWTSGASWPTIQEKIPDKTPGAIKSRIKVLKLRRPFNQ